MRTCIVIPAYNEEKRLPVQSFETFGRTHDVDFLFVDDGSTDNTFEVLTHLTASAPDRFSVLRLRRNAGKAEAVRQGLLEAMKRKASFIGYWDADLATPLETIDEFIDILKKRQAIDVVTGARVSLLGRSIKRKTYRHYLGRIFATVVSMWLHMPVYDTQCGAKLFRVTPSLSAALKKPFITRWIFDAELIARLKKNDAAHPLETRMIEVPLQQWHDVDGSNMKITDFLKGPWEFLRMWWHYRR